MKRRQRIIGWIVASVAAIVFIVVMMVWLAGGFGEKIPPTEAAAVPATPLRGKTVVPVAVTTQPYAEWATGTTRAVHETTLGSRLLARVVAVHVRAGQLVDKDQVLIELDDADLRAQVQQADAVVAAASAALDQAKTEYERIRRLATQQAASELEMTRVTNALRAAEADRQRAERAREEAQTRLSYATVRSPIAGRIVDKKIDVGDTVTPGQPLVTLYDNTRMQLVAVVRESLARRLKVGEYVAVRLDALGLECEGQIHEIVPQAAAASRSFEVKVTGPCPPGVYPGMFGRLRILLDPQETIHVPLAAVRRVGQLDLVDVVNGQTIERRLVRLGRDMDGNVEVLSGLRPGENVAIGKNDETTP